MKTAVVTGASRGIGFACAKKLLRNGYRVAALYHKSEMDARRLTEYGDALFYCADISDAVQTKAAAEQIIDDLSHIDLLVNNAGISVTGLFSDIADDELEALMQTNINGMMRLTRAVVPCMVRQKSGGIINISSMWGQTGGSCEVAYSASKAAVIGFTKALAKELAPSDITVNCIAPGVIMTDMMADYNEIELEQLAQQTPAGRLGTPDDVAAAVAFLASEGARYITGQVLGVNGGLVI